MPLNDDGPIAPDSSSDLYDRATTLVKMGAWQCDLATQALTWTPGVFDIFGIPRNAKIDRRDIVEMYSDESREILNRLRTDAIERQGSFSFDAQIFRIDGGVRWMRLTASTTAANGRSTMLYGIKQDITEERLRWDNMRRLAEQDTLTGLASRGTFQARFLDSRKSVTAIKPLGALVLFDIDGFKQVNDKWGHAAGDACLKAIAERLMTGFPDALMIARIGGDEFAMLMHVDRPVTTVERLVRKQINSLAMPVFWQDKLVEIGVSAGIAGASDPIAYDAEAVFSAADSALYHAKQSGRNAVKVAFQLPSPLAPTGSIVGL